MKVVRYLSRLPVRVQFLARGLVGSLPEHRFSDWPRPRARSHLEQVASVFTKLWACMRREGQRNH